MLRSLSYEEIDSRVYLGASHTWLVEESKAGSVGLHPRKLPKFWTMEAEVEQDRWAEREDSDPDHC